MADVSQISIYYDKIARQLHASRVAGHRDFNDAIEKPALIQLIKNFPSKGRALDVGCGSGIYTRELALLGFHVDGIDVSNEMLTLAKEYCFGLNVDLHHSALQEYNPENTKYQLILASFVVGYFEDLAKFFKRLDNLLSENGALVLSTIHPIRMFSKRMEFEGYALRDYFRGGSYDAVILQNHPTIAQPKRTFSDFLRAAREANLYTDEMLEPTPSRRMEDQNRYEFYQKNPSVLIMSFKKRGAT
jgi:2-polyprenyl-3-methyl-5-hydroxy-6-metoxy-1,4-benzoquinol methylase